MLRSKKIFSISCTLGKSAKSVFQTKIWINPVTYRSNEYILIIATANFIKNFLYPKRFKWKLVLYLAGLSTMKKALEKKPLKKPLRFGPYFWVLILLVPFTPNKCFVKNHQQNFHVHLGPFHCATFPKSIIVHELEP